MNRAPTTHNVQCAERHIWEDIEGLSAHFALQFMRQDSAFLIEDIYEIIQNFKMECRC